MKKIILLLHLFIGSVIYSQNLDNLILLFNNQKNFKIKFSEMYTNNIPSPLKRNVSIDWTVKFNYINKNIDLKKGDTIQSFTKVLYFDRERFMDSIDILGQNGSRLCTDSIEKQINYSIENKIDQIYLIKLQNKFFVIYREMCYEIKLRHSIKDRKKAESRHIQGGIMSLLRDSITYYIIYEEEKSYIYYVFYKNKVMF